MPPHKNTEACKAKYNLRKRKNSVSSYSSERLSFVISTMSDETCAKAAMNKHPKLTLQDKRQIVFDWFTDPDGTDIGKFCVHVKHAPQARRFVRLAVKEFDLIALRNLRNDNPDIDDTVQERIMGFTIPKNEVKKKNSVVADVDSMKKVLIGFFEDESMTRALPFIRKNSDFRQSDIHIFLCLVRRMKLRHMRKKRDEPGIRSKVMSAIEGFVTVESMQSELQNINPNDKSEKKGQVAVIDPTQMKKLLVEWFDDENLPPLPRFLRTKGLFDQRLAMKQIILRLNLHKLRSVREEPGMREKFLKKVDTFFSHETNLTSIGNGSRLLNKHENVFLKNPVAMKTVLKEWYDDEEMLSIVAFLQKKGKPEIRRCVARLVNEANGLRKLRKHRENPGFRQRAMKVIDLVVSEKTTQVQPKLVRKSGNANSDAIPRASQDMVKKAVLEWFEDKQMRSIGRILLQYGLQKYAASAGSLVKSNSLHKLRNRRDDPKARELVKRKIEGLFMPSVASEITGNLKRTDQLAHNSLEKINVNVNDYEEVTMESLGKSFTNSMVVENEEEYVAVDHQIHKESGTEDGFVLLS